MDNSKNTKDHLAARERLFRMLQAKEYNGRRSNGGALQNAVTSGGQISRLDQATLPDIISGGRNDEFDFSVIRDADLIRLCISNKLHNLL